MANNPKDARARLTDLDVREVSVVDRPANKRRFLIVKRDGGLAVFRTEEQMPRTAIPKGAAEDFGHILDADEGDLIDVLKDDDLADLVSLADEDVDDQDGDNGEPDIEPIEKGAVADTIKITKVALAKLMAVANKLKNDQEKAGGKLSAPLAQVVRSVAQALSALVEKLRGDKGSKGDKADPAEKDAKSALAAITASIEKLMAVVNRLQGMEADADVPPAVMSSIGTVASALASMASASDETDMADDKGGGKGDKKDKADDKADDKKDKEKKQPAKKQAAGLSVFISKSDEEDPWIILEKAGRKMKRTRFSTFKKAVEMLSEILAELEDAQKSTNKRTAAQKADDEFQQKMLEGLNGLKDALGKVEKRVDDLQTERPAGADDDPPEPVKKNKSTWSNILGTARS